MNLYDLRKPERDKIAERIFSDVFRDINLNSIESILKYSSDKDTYVRKYSYIAIGKIYKNNENLRNNILLTLGVLLNNEDEKVRQTAVYALGEIGKNDFKVISNYLDEAIYDSHHSVRNSVVGALKQMGQKNPAPVIEFAKKYLHHEDPKIRREVIHGIELRGRTHPDDVLPLLYEVRNDNNIEIRKIIIHVLGQISYKKGCLEKVISHLKTWPNKELVNLALKEIIEVHKNYERFSAYSAKEAQDYIVKELGSKALLSPVGSEGH